MTGRPLQPNRWTLVLLMLIAAGAIHHPTTIAPFLNEIGDEFSVSDAAVGQIGTVNFAAAFFIAILVAPFIGRLELGRFLSLSLVLLAVTGVITAAVPSFWMMFPARAVAGASGGLLAGGSLAAIGRAWPDAEERQVKQGFVVGALAGGPAFMTPPLRVLGEATSWEVAVLAHSGFFLSVAITGWLFLPRLTGNIDTEVTLRQTFSQSVGVVTMPRVGMPLTLRLVSQILLPVFSVFLAGFLASEYLDGEDWIGPAFGLLAIGFMLASFGSGRVTKAVGGPVNTVTINTFTVIAAALAIAWITPHPLVTSIFMLIFGTFIGLYFNGVVTLIFEGAGERQGTAMFVDGALVPVGGMIGSVLGGVALAVGTDYEGWKVLVTALSFGMVVALVAALRVVRPQEPTPIGNAAD